MNIYVGLNVSSGKPKGRPSCSKGASETKKKEILMSVEANRCVIVGGNCENRYTSLTISNDTLTPVD